VARKKSQSKNIYVLKLQILKNLLDRILELYYQYIQNELYIFMLIVCAFLLYLKRRKIMSEVKLKEQFPRAG